GGGLLIAAGAIHLDLYLTGYRSIPTIGWLFLFQVIAAFLLGAAVLASAARLAAAAGAAFSLVTLGGYLLSLWIGLFGFKEVRTTAGIAAGVVEVAAFAALAGLAAMPAERGRAGGRLLARLRAGDGRARRHRQALRVHPLGRVGPGRLRRAPAVHLRRRQRSGTGQRQRAQPERRPVARGTRVRLARAIDAAHPPLRSTQERAH